MKVILIRHFKVDHQWNKHCTGAEFFENLECYNTRPVIETKDLEFPATTVYISTLSRTAETAKYIKGEKTIVKTPLINEVDLSGSTRIKLRLPARLWYIIAFTKWKMNSVKQRETFLHTKERAIKFLRMIEEKNEDCIVVSHGMFLIVLLEIMMKNEYSGWKKTNRIGNGEVIEMVKKIT